MTGYFSDFISCLLVLCFVFVLLLLPSAFCLLALLGEVGFGALRSPPSAGRSGSATRHACRRHPPLADDL